MKRTVASLLALGLAAATATASAQSYGYPGDYGHDRDYAGMRDDGGYYDEARVIRVDPVLDGHDDFHASEARRCTTTSAGRHEYEDRYRDPYRGGAYPGHPGDGAGRSMATVAGGIIGAVLGSKVGGGSGRYAATAVGSMVGSIAGREIYDQGRRERYARAGAVRVCDPEPVGHHEGYGRGYGGYRGQANAYDVTYVYNGRKYTRRMDYHPGDRVRVRVDVTPE